jgi:two-component system, cell cycle sensor histidine kinase and response regulator CckA
MGRAANVLLVDDEADVRQVTGDLLRFKGFEVNEAESAEDALRILTDGGRVDVLVTDIAMPEKDGFMLAVEARQMRPGLPVVFVTGYSRRNDLDGAPGPVVRKPYTAAELTRAIDEVLSKIG